MKKQIVLSLAFASIYTIGYGADQKKLNQEKQLRLFHEVRALENIVPYLTLIPNSSITHEIILTDDESKLALDGKLSWTNEELDTKIKQVSTQREQYENRLIAYHRSMNTRSASHCKLVHMP